MSMTKEKAIAQIEKLKSYCEYMKDSDENGAYVFDLDVQALDFVLSALTQPNEPLTLEELSLFNAPVWIKRIADRNLRDSGWTIVEGPRCSTWFNGIPMSWEIRVWWPGSEVADYPKHEDYGKTWIAYRRPPEEPLTCEGCVHEISGHENCNYCIRAGYLGDYYCRSQEVYKNE